MAVKKLLLIAVTAIVVVLGMAVPASAQYNPMYITATPLDVQHCSTAPGSVTVTAGYFTPGSEVTITMQSDPVTLGTATADATGNITGTFVLPAATTQGQHTITATGARLGTGVSESVSAQITVTFPAGCVSNQTTTPTTTTGGGSLPVTGSDNGMFVAIGAALLVAGGLLVMATRKRNAARA